MVLIAHTIAEYLKTSKTVVLLDGIEYLIMNRGFDVVSRMVEDLIDKIAESRSILIIPVNPDAMEKRELELLERNAEVIT